MSEVRVTSPNPAMLRYCRTCDSLHPLIRRLTIQECAAWYGRMDYPGLGSVPFPVSGSPGPVVHKEEGVVANVAHAFDCSVHNEPAYPAGPCDCVVMEGLSVTGPDAEGWFWVHARTQSGKCGSVRVRSTGIVGEVFAAFVKSTKNSTP